MGLEGGIQDEVGSSKLAYICETTLSQTEGDLQTRRIHRRDRPPRPWNRRYDNSSYRAADPRCASSKYSGQGPIGALLRVLDVAPSRGHITAIDDEPTVLMFIQ